MSKSRHSAKQRKRQTRQVLLAFNLFSKEFTARSSASTEEPLSKEEVKAKLHKAVKDAQAITLK